jgi:hypothetical protein
MIYSFGHGYAHFSQLLFSFHCQIPGKFYEMLNCKVKKGGGGEAIPVTSRQGSHIF